mmetsp:Transcript_68791/g.161796  ORF Transcript_68791/g.161796 Transcript_68791/m.161796 type:complete len:308 (-) Transcript_68791:2178-3101(-)
MEQRAGRRRPVDRSAQPEPGQQLRASGRVGAGRPAGRACRPDRQRPALPPGRQRLRRAECPRHRIVAGPGGELPADPLARAQPVAAGRLRKQASAQQGQRRGHLELQVRSADPGLARQPVRRPRRRRLHHRLFRRPVRQPQPGWLTQPGLRCRRATHRWQLPQAALPAVAPTDPGGRRVRLCLAARPVGQSQSRLVRALLPRRPAGRACLPGQRGRRCDRTAAQCRAALAPRRRLARDGLRRLGSHHGECRCRLRRRRDAKQLLAQGSRPQRRLRRPERARCQPDLGPASGHQPHGGRPWTRPGRVA